jgi:hypothetical protein
MQTVGHEPDKFAFFGGAHVHQDSVAGLHECPCILRRHATGVGQAGFGGAGSSGFEQRVGGSFYEFKRHDVSFDIARILTRRFRANGESNRL